MALTTEGTQITEAHRLAQVGISEETERDVETAFRSLLDPRRIESTFPLYFEAAAAVLDRDHERSKAVSAAYLDAFHQAEAKRTEPLDLRIAERLSREQALSSLFWTGPAQIRKGISRQGRTATQAAEVAVATTRGASKRLALQGGRYTVRDTVQATTGIKGYARVTDADPCSFCAMLASRGADYKRGSFQNSNARFTGFGSAKVHDGCGCQMEPVYGRGDDYKSPGRSKEFEDLWSEIPPGLSPGDQRRAFRGLYERGAVPDKYLRG